MLGRGVADRLATSSPESLFAPEIVEIANEADLFVMNLECCVSERGTRWPAPGKASSSGSSVRRRSARPPRGRLRLPGQQPRTRLRRGGPAGHVRPSRPGRDRVGGCRSRCRSGPSSGRAERPAPSGWGSCRCVIIPRTSQPAPVDPGWPSPTSSGASRTGCRAAVRSVEADAVLVTPHWGPNMVRSPSLMSGGQPKPWSGRDHAGGRSFGPRVPGVQGRVLFDLGASSTTTPSIRSSGTTWGSCGSSRWTRVGPPSLRPCR